MEPKFLNSRSRKLQKELVRGHVNQVPDFPVLFIFYPPDLFLRSLIVEKAPTMQTASLLTPTPLLSPHSPLPSKTHVSRFPRTVKSPKQSQTLKTLTRVSSNQTTAESPVSPPPPHPSIDSASDVVRKFYGRINIHDLDSVVDLISENCVYEDLIFSQPFVGRKASGIPQFHLEYA